MELQAAKYIGAGVGIGTVFGALVIGISRNSSFKDEFLKWLF